jgi:hypothetical protein
MQKLSAIADGIARLVSIVRHQTTGLISTALSRKASNCLSWRLRQRTFSHILLRLITHPLGSRTNVQVFAIVLDIQNVIKSIPGQIERQQPVFLIDALGKLSPFHLEFIRSADVSIIG